MSNISGLIDQLNKNKKKLSKSHLKIAEYITINYYNVVNMTALQLSQAVGTSEATVIRFAKVLGFEGYPEFQSALHELLNHRLTATQRFYMSQSYDKKDVLDKVLKHDIQNIKQTLEITTEEVFEDVIQRILDANTIYVMGLRSAAPLAQFFYNYLSIIFDKVKLVSNGFSDEYETIALINKDDVLIGISFPRYSTNTIESMRFAKQNNAQVIGITDGKMSPLTEYADICLFAQTNMVSFADSLSAPFSLLNALIISLGLHKKEELNKHFDRLEKIWEAKGVYINQRK